jgi:hypothetical protein
MANQESTGVKLILTYDPLPERRESYLRYVQGEFIPSLEFLGLTLCDAWHTAYGPYPLRLAGFEAPDWDTMERVLSSEAFQELESRLQDYVVNYQRKIVEQRSTFQF